MNTRSECSALYPRLFGLFLLACCSTFAHAESVSPEADNIAEFVSSHSWPNVEQMLPAIVRQLENDLKEGGATGRAAATFASEFQRTLNKQAVARLLAKVVAREMTPEEQRTALAFVQTSAGAKLFAIGGSGRGVEAIALPLIRELCTSLKTQLSRADADSLSACR